MKKCKYPKLDGLITEKVGTRKVFAKKIGISANSVSSKMSGTYPWKPAEIEKACNVLGISNAEINIYFF